MNRIRSFRVTQYHQPVEARHATVNMLLLIYGRLDGRVLRFGNPISSSARCQEFYSYLHKVLDHSTANWLSSASSALVAQRATYILLVGQDESAEFTGMVAPYR